VKDILQNLLFVILCLSGVFFVRESVVEGFRIPSQSMSPTLEVNDYILVFKLAYGFKPPFFSKPIIKWRPPARGVPIVFVRDDDPSTKTDESANHIIKRVIGLPGEKVEIVGRKVFINDSELSESYATWKRNNPEFEHYGPVTVPPTGLFVLGDNRDESQDSRFWGDQPFVSIDKVIGRAFLIYYSKQYSRFGKVIN
jgi:signal peptidase I